MQSHAITRSHFSSSFFRLRSTQSALSVSQSSSRTSWETSGTFLRRFLRTRGREGSWSEKVQWETVWERARPRNPVPLPSSRMREVDQCGRRGVGGGKWCCARRNWARWRLWGIRQLGEDGVREKEVPDAPKD